MEKLDKIKFLIKVSKTEDIFKKYRDQIILQFEHEVSEEKYEEVIDFFVKNYDTDKYISKVIDLYMEIFTDDEIDYIYNQSMSEMWQNINKKVNILVERSTKFGEEMGEEMMQKIEENYDNWKK